MCELVSLGSNSLLAGENTGNFVDPEFGGHIPQRQKWSQISPLRTNSLHILTGNFWEPCRELDLTIRELSARIREACPTLQADPETPPPAWTLTYELG